MTDAYITTWTIRGKETHLRGISDFTLCGLDESGDEYVHLKEPKFYESLKAVTCEDCKRIIKTVQAHIKLGKGERL